MIEIWRIKNSVPSEHDKSFLLICANIVIKYCSCQYAIYEICGDNPIAGLAFIRYGAIARLHLYTRPSRLRNSLPMATSFSIPRFGFENSNDRLELHFDDLDGNVKNYYYLINCAMPTGVRLI